ncbi:MAG: magnesium transporter [Oscillospiraceae bacterium]
MDEKEEKPLDLKELLEEKKYAQLKDAFVSMNEVDIAQFISGLTPTQAALAFRTLPKADEMEVFAELDTDVQQGIIQSISDAEVSSLIEELWVDDAVDMLEEMPASLVKKVLRNSSAATRAQLNHFLRYPENSAGSIMTAEFTDLRPNMSVAEAIKRIRRVGEDRETIYTCYVIDKTRHLLGTVTIKALLLAKDDGLVSELMEEDIISVETTADQEEAAKLMAKYGLISLPVVDTENRLVGIVTVDDALEVIQEEDTEDFEKMNAMLPSEKPYLKTGVFQLAKNRIGWLMILMVSGMVTSILLGLYQDMYTALPLLVSFIPMLTGTGGNAGSQSSTMVIRGMALGEINLKDWVAVLWKETRVSVIVGVILSLVNLVRLLVFYPGTGLLPLVVTLTLIASILFAKTVGGVLPLAAKACKMDPAVMAAPLITTLVDAFALVIYFTIAKVFLM